MIEKALSEKIRLLSWVATIMVVIRHSLNLEAFYGDSMAAPLWLRSVEHIGSLLTESAIPIFFMISGYFFSRIQLNRVRDYWDMISKKSRTLLLPFLIWNLVGLCILTVSGRFVESEHWWEYLYRLVDSEYNGVLWYVRNLMFMMLLYPIYHWVYSVNTWYLYAPWLLYLLWRWWPVDMTWMSSEGWLFFVLGGTIYHKVNVGRLFSKKVAWSVVVGWLTACIILPWGNIYVHKFVVLLGVLAVWCFCSSILFDYKDSILRLTAYTFLIFVLHQFVIKAMKVSVAEEYFQNSIVAISSYFLLPIVTIGIVVFIGYWWKRLLPRTYSWCVGGRMS